MQRSFCFCFTLYDVLESVYMKGGVCMMKRIAIYARKSVESDKGDSIKNQFTKCMDYIKATDKSNEELTFIEYKDEGYTGANTFRPGYQRLLRDIEQGKIDMLVCYRIDRITRSVADFSDINKRLERHKVSFASVNETFDTSTTMGRAMLGIIIVFAQLERETISERITDNMFELAKTERWIGGTAPLGYKLHRFEIPGTKKKQTKLVIDEATAPNIQLIFDKYIELRSMSRIETYLLQQHIKSQNGKDLSTAQLALILRNPTYVKADERIKDFYVKKGTQFHGEVNGECGLMTYAKTKTYITDEGKQGLTKNTEDKWIISVGTHSGIVDADVWLEAQRIMKENYNNFPRVQKSNTALVSSLLRCSDCGSTMYVSYGRKTKEGEKGYYYICKKRKKSQGTHCTNKNVRADFVDQAVINELKKKAIDKEQFLNTLREQLKQGKQELAHDPVEIIKSDIKKKEAQVKRLVDRISRTDNEDLAIDYENQIRSLKMAIGTLSAELSVIGEKKTKVYQAESFLTFVEELLDKCGLIDKWELEEQKELVRALFKRIIWNSKTGILSFEYIGDDEDRDGSSGVDNSDGGGNDDMDDSGEYALLDSAMMGNNEMSHFHKLLNGGLLST